MIVALATLAYGAPAERNLSATTVGFQTFRSPSLAFEPPPGEEKPPSLEPTDTDILLGQRLRWTLFESDSTAVRLRMNGQFTLSPGDDALFKRNRVRQLGVSVVNDSFTLDVGRHGVHKGGPRLVDGIQFIAHASETLDVGVWGGLAPDLFTTDPRMRPGFGPIVAYTTSRVQASVAGDVVFGGGGLDRMGTLLQARVSAARTLDLAVRADVEFSGGPRLVDGQVFGRWSPTDTLSIDALYNVFSSYIYQRTQDLDPDIQRFDARLINNNPGFLPELIQNCVDPNVAHMVGGDFRLRPSGRNTGFMASLSGRYRVGTDVDVPDVQQGACFYDDTNAFMRVSPRVGLANLPVGGGLDVSLDGNLYVIEGVGQSDAGVTVFFEPLADGVLAIDASYRMLFNRYKEGQPAVNPQGYYGTGHYADLFVDVVVPPADLMFGVGLNLESEPSELVNEVGIGAFGRLTKYIRPRRKKQD